MILWSEPCLAHRVGLYSSGMMAPNTLKLKNYDETTLPLTLFCPTLLLWQVVLVLQVCGYSKDAWVGRCDPGVQTLTLFKTQFSDFHIPFETEFKFSDPI